MIATPRFLFLHLHKSGGTFINESLLRYIPGAVAIGYHLPWRVAPPEFRDLPAVGFVRNPWGYYVSWYSFQRSLPRQNALFRVLSEDGRLGFDGTIRNMLSLAFEPALLQAVIDALPAGYEGRGLNLPGPALAPILGSERGFYSYLSDYMFAGAADLRLGRMESLRTDLPHLLEELGEPMSEEFRAHVRSARPSNTSPHGPIADYYEPDLTKLVALRDAPLIERFGYHLER